MSVRKSPVQALIVGAVMFLPGLLIPFIVMHVEYRYLEAVKTFGLIFLLVLYYRPVARMITNLKVSWESVIVAGSRCGMPSEVE